ncbi:gamma-interferon-inducible lysosomal thiol reductase-like [Galleria mellonella]|uniref:Gamma-interferon-inducible lysosomal thiol reductase-like n=1 Tax=Galleria mellonella TaxID=7137 RepID=A0ABM3N3T6_GALME|nr:gamma-interferon-inducible lysosomal thiol reductase-like [Galleria mellonella]
MYTKYILCFVYIFVYINTQEVEIVSNALGNANVIIKLIEEDLEIAKYKILNTKEKKVNIKLYYECLCPDCRRFDSKELKKVVERLTPYLKIETYPYGNAKTSHINGKIEFKCQHGPKECYGNKLHACSLNIINNATDALLFNICMTDPEHPSGGSDDPTADACGEKMAIDAKTIKECAKSEKGNELLEQYGIESDKVHYKYVPYVLINGNEWTGNNFMKDVCAAFSTPPPPCVEEKSQNEKFLNVAV